MSNPANNKALCFLCVKNGKCDLQEGKTQKEVENIKHCFYFKPEEEEEDVEGK